MLANPSSRAIRALREATGDLHEQLEASLQVVSRLRSPVERPALIRGYERMLGGAREASRPWLDGMDGVAAIAAPPASPAAPGPTLTGRAEALGFHYVMVGSALGGRVMLRELERDGVDTAALGFLDPHGSRTGEVWRRLLDLLERELAEPDALAQAVAGARKGFAFARTCLEPRA